MNYIINKEQYLKLKESWKKHEATGHTKSDMIAYNILRGFDPKRGFSPKTNAIKLANGMTPWQAYELGRGNLRYQLKWIPQEFMAKFDIDEATLLKLLEATK